MDDCTFTCEGISDVQNRHVLLSSKLLNKRLRACQKRFSLNVWAGIMGDHLIGPYFLPCRLKSKMYLNYFQNYFNPAYRHVYDSCMIEHHSTTTWMYGLWGKQVSILLLSWHTCFQHRRMFLNICVSKKLPCFPTSTRSFLAST